MQNSGTRTVFIILSFIAGIVVVGIVGYVLGKSNSPTVNNYYTDTQTSHENQSSLSNSAVVAEWQSLPETDLLATASAENIYLDPESGVGLQETLDLTGDGIDEAIFEGNGGNNGMAFIMTKDTTGANVVAQQKNKDGGIYPVQLLSVGRVMVQETFKLLPGEHGFYTASLSYDESAGKFICNTDGVNAYSWNTPTDLFEWSQALTTKYAAEVCK